MVGRYQGMVKGYSGVFRLGEATSTLDADSPVPFLSSHDDCHSVSSFVIDKPPT